MKTDATTPGRHDATFVPSWRRCVVASLWILGACAGHTRVPSSLRGYEILVSGRDTLDQALERALRESGFHVRRAVKGGGPPAAALLHFVFQEPPPAPVPWLHARLYDTRSGVILGAVMIRLDSIGPAGRVRARAIVDSLLAGADSL